MKAANIGIFGKDPTTEIFVSFHILRCHNQDEIRVAGDIIALLHVFELQHGAAEFVQQIGAFTLQFHLNDEGHGTANGFGGEDRDIRLDNAIVSKALDTPLDRGSGNADLVAHFIGREAIVILQDLKQGFVDLV
jgi:hypothetical protein